MQALGVILLIVVVLYVITQILHDQDHPNDRSDDGPHGRSSDMYK